MTWTVFVRPILAASAGWLAWGWRGAAIGALVTMVIEGMVADTITATRRLP